MNTIEIDKELEKMTNAERLILIEKATRLVRSSAGFKRTSEEPSDLRRSAEIMRSEYLANTELIALTDLDGEEFIDA